jgi:NADPH2:quinone reductase
MRAVVCHRFGPPEDLAVEACDEPEPGPGEVLVDVRACSVCFPDVLLIQDRYQVTPPLPFVPGSEVSGVVRAVGADVDGIAVGDRVLGAVLWGGLAERVVLSAGALSPIPDGVDFVHAAAFVYAYGTSHYALRHRANLQAGETLVVLGAAGGVGLAAVELGAHMGAVVIAAASSEEKLAECRRLGAAMTIDYSREDLKTCIRELTGGAGADVVYDAVGGPYSEPALRAMAWGGRFLVVGFAAGDIPRVPLNLVLLRGCEIDGVFLGGYAARDRGGHRRHLDELMEWWRAGALHPHVSKRYPLAEAAQALRDLMDRRAVGKLVVTMT